MIIIQELLKNIFYFFILLFIILQVPFFFTDKIIHQIVEDKGDYNFSFQIKFIIFSTIISSVFLRLFLILIKTEKEIVTIKYEKNIKLLNELKEKMIKRINIKYTIFFILNIILLSLFWYYLTCFNAIYQNTQLYLIKNTLISFGLSLAYPFIINIFPCILRINSLNSKGSENAKNKKKKGDKECFYTASKFLQIL